LNFHKTSVRTAEEAFIEKLCSGAVTHHLSAVVDATRIGGPKPNIRRIEDRVGTLRAADKSMGAGRVSELARNFAAVIDPARTYTVRTRNFDRSVRGASTQKPMDSGSILEIANNLSVALLIPVTVVDVDPGASTVKKTYGCARAKGTARKRRIAEESVRIECLAYDAEIATSILTLCRERSFRVSV